MSGEEKLKYIAQKKEEREKIRKQISDLNQKRVSYVAAQKSIGKE